MTGIFCKKVILGEGTGQWAVRWFVFFGCFLAENKTSIRGDGGWCISILFCPPPRTVQPASSCGRVQPR